MINELRSIADFKGLPVDCQKRLASRKWMTIRVNSSGFSRYMKMTGTGNVVEVEQLHEGGIVGIRFPVQVASTPGVFTEPLAMEAPPHYP